ncbi:MAG: Rid family detoxifying hydrolase [Ferruginibacter sp.]
MAKTIIETAGAPAPIGPYSQAVRAGNLLFVSGQIALVPESGNVISGEIKEETAQVMKNIKAILTEAGLNFGNIVKTSIFLSDMSLFAAVNEEYGKYFEGKSAPARETIAVKGLPKNVNVEISVTAMFEA